MEKTNIIVRALRVARFEDPELQPLALEILLMLKAAGPHSTIPQSALVQTTGSTKASVSRNLKVLGVVNAGGRALGFVRVEPDPANGRTNLVWLTPRGNAFVNRLLNWKGD